MSSVRSPIKWYGGKFYIAKLICSLMPEHSVYVEVFGGAGHVLFAKPRSDVEVYNDIHDGLVTLFRVIRDKPDELQAKLKWTLYSRSEFNLLREKYRNQDFIDDVDKAATVFYLIKNSINAKMSTFSVGRTPTNTSRPNSYYNAINTLKIVSNRLRNVIIECLDFRKLIKVYDTENTLFYLDPPYVINSRRSGRAYKHEMSDNDHIELLDLLKTVKGKWILSGYRNEIYDTELSQFRYMEIRIPLHSRISGSTKPYATEVLWFNYDPPLILPFFEGQVTELLYEEEDYEDNQHV